jgi:dUTP pyrophosphatase
MKSRTAFEKVSFAQWVEDAHQQTLSEISEDQKNFYWEEYRNINLPRRATSHSAGYDIFSTFDFVLSPQQDIKLPLGWKIYLKEDEFLMVVPRSGLGFKYYTRLANSVGVIDSDYADNKTNEGHCWIKFRNEGNVPFSIKAGEAIAQAIIVPFRLMDDDTYEGATRVGGFGSTDMKPINTFIEDLRRLLEEGVDDFWWKVTENGNFDLINRLRESAGLSQIPVEKLQEAREYWRIYG